MSRKRIAELCKEKQWVDVELAFYVARVAGVKRVVEILEAQPKRVLDGCGRERGDTEWREGR